LVLKQVLSLEPSLGQVGYFDPFERRVGAELTCFATRYIVLEEKRRIGGEKWKRGRKRKEKEREKT
jgi:hypothetical protein